MFIGASIVPIISADQGNPPIISSESPADEAEDIPITTSSLSVFIYDIDGDTLDWTITTFPVIGYNCGYDEDDGTKTCNISGLLEYGTTYTWTVTATDFYGKTTTKTFTFTTRPENYSPEFLDENPSNNSIDISPSLSELSVMIGDREGDRFSWTIETFPDIGSSSGNDEYNGTKICPVSSLESVSYTHLRAHET